MTAYKTVYLKEDEFDAALILKHSDQDTDYRMSWEDSFIEFLLIERDIGETDEDFLDTFEVKRDEAIRDHYRYSAPRWKRFEGEIPL